MSPVAFGSCRKWRGRRDGYVRQVRSTSTCFRSHANSYDATEIRTDCVLRTFSFNELYLVRKFIFGVARPWCLRCTQVADVSSFNCLRSLKRCRWSEIAYFVQKDSSQALSRDTIVSPTIVALFNAVYRCDLCSTRDRSIVRRYANDLFTETANNFGLLYTAFRSRSACPCTAVWQTQLHEAR